MKRVRTHYDNLRVTRNAPPEVIQAAYRALCQKYHPDLNRDNPNATRIMAIINTSHDVLSDPVRRRQHDRWIVEKEAEIQEALDYDELLHQDREDHDRMPAQAPAAPAGTPMMSAMAAVLFGPSMRHIMVPTMLIGLVGGCWLLSTFGDVNLLSGQRPAVAAAIVEKPQTVAAVATSKAVLMPTRRAYLRPALAPNGQPWPATAGYIDGTPRLAGGGLSNVTVDNSRNNSDVHVKLMQLDGNLRSPVREFYIPAHSMFTATKIRPGRYDIRYRDLGNGHLSRSEPIALEETRTYDGTHYTDMTFTLYKIVNGNMETYSIAESDF